MMPSLIPRRQAAWLVALATYLADDQSTPKKERREDPDDDSDMTEEERRDEILKETFPASDPAPPPTHLSSDE